MRWVWIGGLAAVTLGLAGCGTGSTVVGALGSAASGMVAVGQAAVGVAGTVVSAGTSAVVGGAHLAGSAASVALSAAASPNGPTGASGAAAGAGGAGAGASLASGVVLASGAAAANQVSFTEAGNPTQALEVLGQEAMAEAEALLQLPRNPLDSCALEMFRSMAQSSGFATARRWANDVSADLGDHDALALSGLYMLTSVIQVRLMQAQDNVRNAVQEALDLPGTVDAQTAFAAIRDAQSLCPAGVMGRLSELSLET